MYGYSERCGLLKASMEFWCTLESVERMNIFITGGTGFVGSWLVKRLLKEDAQVTL